METFEAWSDGDSIVLALPEVIREQRNKGLLGEGARFLHAITARSWEEAMAAYQQMMGWEPY